MEAKLKYQICKPVEGDPNRIKIAERGSCLVYIPEIASGDSFGPRISLDFGTSVLMLDLDDFRSLARQILYGGHDGQKENIVQLRLVK